MPDVRNCRKCGKIFNYIGGPSICPVCKELDEQDFKRVKEYLYDHPGATMSEVSTALEISVERIKSYLREGRLEIVGEQGNIVLECENCGKAIRSGRFCDECSKSLSKGFEATARQIGDSISQKEADAKKAVAMRYLNKEGK